MFNDVFSYFLIQDDEFKYKDVVQAQYARRARWLATFLPMKLLAKTSFPVRFAVVGSKYRQLIRDLLPERVLLIGGPVQLALAWKTGAGFLSQMRLYRALTDCFVHRDSRHLHRIVDDGAQTLRRSGANVLVVTNDSLPVERMWIAAARRCGALSICVQHGLFAPGNPINDGKYADVICAYDAHQKRILEDTGARDVRILGYFEDCESLSASPADRDVCILGQPWVDYYQGLGRRYLSELHKIVRVLDGAGVDWRYKPHPSERTWSEYGSRISSKVYRRHLKTAFRTFRAFVSLTSTALLEATLHGRMAVQVHHPDFKAERFSDYGYAHTVDADRIEILPALLKEDLPLSAPFDQRPLKDRFLEIVDASHFRREDS